MAVPAVPVALKVTGVRDPVVAVNVFDPAVVPKVQLPTVAIPLPLVVALKPVPEPPPVATAKVTLTPLTGMSLASFTITLGAIDTGVPIGADWLSPAFIAIWVGGPGVITVTELEAVLSHLSVAVAVADTTWPAVKAVRPVFVHDPEATVVVPLEIASTITLMVVPSSSVLVPLTEVAPVRIGVVTIGAVVTAWNVTVILSNTLAQGVAPVVVYVSSTEPAVISAAAGV